MIWCDWLSECFLGVGWVEYGGGGVWEWYISREGSESRCWFDFRCFLIKSVGDNDLVWRVWEGRVFMFRYIFVRG